MAGPIRSGQCSGNAREEKNALAAGKQNPLDEPAHTSGVRTQVATLAIAAGSKVFMERAVAIHRLYLAAKDDDADISIALNALSHAFVNGDDSLYANAARALGYALKHEMSRGDAMRIVRSMFLGDASLSYWACYAVSTALDAGADVNELRQEITGRLDNASLNVRLNAADLLLRMDADEITMRKILAICNNTLVHPTVAVGHVCIVAGLLKSLVNKGVDINSVLDPFVGSLSFYDPLGAFVFSPIEVIASLLADNQYKERLCTLLKTALGHEAWNVRCVAIQIAEIASSRGLNVASLEQNILVALDDEKTRVQLSAASFFCKEDVDMGTRGKMLRLISAALRETGQTYQAVAVRLLDECMRNKFDISSISEDLISVLNDNTNPVRVNLAIMLFSSCQDKRLREEAVRTVLDKWGQVGYSYYKQWMLPIVLADAEEKGKSAMLVHEFMNAIRKRQFWKESDGEGNYILSMVACGNPETLVAVVRQIMQFTVSEEFYLEMEKNSALYVYWLTFCMNVLDKIQKEGKLDSFLQAA